MASLNKRQLIVELSTDNPILVREATRIFEENYFNPAVEEMQKEFEDSPITEELDAAANDVSIEGSSGCVSGGTSSEAKNLFAFIGFEEGSNPTDEIRPFLDPENPYGPKYKYIRGSKSRDNLEFKFKVFAPDIDVIHKSTPMPWAPGLSWAKRIEIGIPGLSKFLNKLDLRGSRSGGGIQVENTLRQARFKPKKYLSKIIGNFLKRITG